MKNKIKEMVEGLGELTIESISSWMPGVSKEEIIREIKNSDSLVLVGDKVTLAQKSAVREVLPRTNPKKSGQIRMIIDIIMDQRAHGNPAIILMTKTKLLLKGIRVDNYTTLTEDDPVIIKKLLDIAKDLNIDFGNKLNLAQNSAVAEVLPWTNYIEKKASEKKAESKEIQEISNVEEIEVVDNNEASAIEEAAISIEEDTISSEENDNIINYEQPIAADSDETGVNKIMSRGMTYEEIINIINKYNSSVEEEYIKLTESVFNNKVKAILKYYGIKYNVKPFDVGVDSNAKVYTLCHLKNDAEIGYLLVTERLTEKLMKKIEGWFTNEIVYICVTDEVEVKFEVGLNEFYLKETDDIINQYMEHFKLESIACELKKIET